MSEDDLGELFLSRQELFNSIPLGMVVQNAEGYITAANPAAEMILGLSIEQMRGRHSLDPRWKSTREDGSPFPGDAHPTMIAIKKAKTVEDVVMGIYNPITEKQSWLSVTATPIFDRDGRTVKAAYAVFRDITKSKRAEDGLKRANLRLAQLTEKLTRMAQTDALTGLANRHSFNHAMAVEFQRFGRFQIPVAVLMLDIDHFKQINDRFGHEAGDQALVALGAILKESVRVMDIAARYGGEEFVLVYTGADLTAALLKAEQIRRRLREFSLPLAEGNLEMRVSIGISCLLPEDKAWTLAIQRADHALYRAKNEGRDRIVVQQEAVAVSTARR